MAGQPDDVRAALTFKTARRSMVIARKASIPASPSTIEEIISDFDAGKYPALYQEMYVGSVEHDFEGILNTKEPTLILLPLLTYVNYDLKPFHLGQGPQSRTKKHAILLANRSVSAAACTDCKSWSMDATFRCTPRQGRVLNLRSSQVLIVINGRVPKIMFSFLY